MNWILLASIMVALLAFGLAIWLLLWVKRQPQENLRIREIGSYIKQGARTFLKREYKMLFWFTLVAAILILLFLPKFIWQDNPVDNIWMAISYIFGTLFSGIAGIIGMEVATSANMRTAEAAKKGIKPAFLVGFRGGSVMGMAVVGGSLLGVALVFFLVGNSQALLGFSFGASSLALFAKAGGGIFTKTADISADLVGKVELGIPEDDPRNPAVIADNVGDNVGDVAGMGADLFESYVGAIVSAITLGVFAYQGEDGVSFAFMVSSVGIIASILGTLFVRGKEGSNPQKALNMGTYASSLIVMIASFFLSKSILGSYQPFGSIVFGVFVGLIIAKITEIYTMMINVYVNNKDELNRKVQEYTVQDYNIKFANDDTVVMKKKDYNLAIFIILLLLGIIFGLIYYLVSEETTVQIQIDPNRSNHQNTPTQPSSNTLPVSNTPNMSDTIFCTNCGSKILKTENFCPNCGYKKTVQHEKEN